MTSENDNLSNTELSCYPITDHATVLKTVVDRISTIYLLKTNVKLGATYPASVAADARVRQGVEAAREYMNAESVREVVMGSSATQLLGNMARAMEPTLKPTDEIIVTNSDHETNIGAFINMASRQKLTVKFWQVDLTSLLPTRAWWWSLTVPTFLAPLTIFARLLNL
ncbi:hypothetical protein BC937DRAFT_90624 [Endogone sp. FLAS-F59071]|nr:hypothetical protein BC937DRAFT_90624 [Endogone sp. FLAS-F59071]|eukprot:RUS16944.1 hypothetical protein BC937DRAFT_90624 [Endogone sp. FLAS-F59071]